jgi:hypothetical protein
MRRVGWQPSRFLATRPRPTGFQLTKRLGSINAAGHKDQLIDQAAGRLRNSRMQQRGRGDDQDGAGLELASGGRWEQ